MLLFDAQTSGGLLLAVPPAEIERLFARAADVGQVLWQVGEVVEGERIAITL
jgi:selenide, water dikinase